MIRDLRQLQLFLNVVQCGSIGRAADACGMTQPSLSRIIQKLEEHVGDLWFQLYIVHRTLSELCSGLMNLDTDLGENPRHEEVSDDQTTSFVFPGVQTASCLLGARPRL